MLCNPMRYLPLLLVACSSGEPVSKTQEALCSRATHFWIDSAVERPGGTCGLWVGSNRPLYLAGETQLAYGTGTGPMCWWANNPTCTVLGGLSPGVFTGLATCSGFTGNVPDYTVDFVYDLRTTPVTRTARRYQDRRGGCSSTYDLVTHVTH